MTQLKRSSLDLNLKALVVADDATMSRIVDDYLKQNGPENTATSDNDLLPQAIFWLKKRGVP